MKFRPEPARKEKPHKMGFDFFYFLPCRCTVCGTCFQVRNDGLWVNRCPDCSKEQGQDQEEPFAWE